MTESLRNTTHQSVSTCKEASVVTENRASVTESLHNTTLQSVSTGKDASTITDNRAAMTGSLHNTTHHPINTNKAARTTGENVRSPPRTRTLHTTTTTTSTATQEAPGDNNTTKKRNFTVGDRMRHFMMDTWDDSPAMEDLEADSYYITHRCSTCKQKCGLRDALRPRHCYCDRACLQIGDCCLDYEASCLSGPTVTRKNFGYILRSRKSPTAKCVNIPQGTGNQETLMVVSSCGNEIMTTTDNVTLNRCERPFATNEGLVAVIPVIFRDVFYSNKYCAI